MPFACKLVLQILDWGDPAEAEEPFNLYRALRDLALTYPIEDIRVCRTADTILPPAAPAPTASGLPLPADDLSTGRVPAPPPPASGLQPPAPAPKPVGRKPSAVSRPPASRLPPPASDALLRCAACGEIFGRISPKGVPPKFCKRTECQRTRWAAAQRGKPSAKVARLAFNQRRRAAAPAPRLCEHCGEPLKPHAPGRSRFCSKPECRKAKQLARYRGLTKAERIELIRKAVARRLAKKRPLAGPDPSDPSDPSDLARDEAEADRRLGATARE